jgi:beta propeller repeat protein
MGSATSSQTAPAISGTRVVWTDRTMLGGGSFNSDIVYVDTATATAPRNLTNTALEQEYLEDIDATYLVYTHSGPGMPGDILLYDLAGGAAQTIAASDSVVTYSLPAVSGRYVVYVRTLNGPGGAQVDIDGYDIATGSPVGPITGDAALQSHPRVSGELVVYEDYGTGDADIHGWRVSTGASFPIATGAQQQRTPDIDGNWVVWVESQGGTDQIVGWNASTGALQNFTTVASNKIQPRVSGNRVVWADDRSGNFDIRAYDLSTGVEDVLVDGPGDQVLSDIDGGRVVYSSNESGFEQIYLFEYASTPPPPPPGSKPRGCDPAFTDLVAGPTVLSKPGKKPVMATGQWNATKGKRYFMCVENGKPDGSLRTGHFLGVADGRVVLTPANFLPHANPPRWVAAEIRLHCGDDDDDDDHCGGHGHGHGHGHSCGGKHDWRAMIFSNSAAQAAISIRVAK